MLILDCEVYSNYFLLMFKSTASGRYASYELFEGREFDTGAVSRNMSSHTTVSFNGNSFDIVMIAAALAGRSCEQLKALCDDLILSKLPAWKIAREHNVTMPKAGRWDHIDLIEVAPGKASLKIYGGRLGAPTMQDLPFIPSDTILPEQREIVRSYCANDLDTTERLYRKLEPAIKLREDMSAQYGGIDLRSKSDAQIAEAVIAHELETLTGNRYKPITLPDDHVCAYKDPKIVSFETPTLRDVFKRILETGFPIGANGSVKIPEWLQNTKIKIGLTEYQMGVGGLHSCEKSRSVVVSADEMLCDFDVASYYPSIILMLRLFPKKMGKDFLKVYQSIVSRRLEAKKRGDKLVADTLKIVVNGSFGKLGSKYSALFAPELMIQTTITGQLCLLMLIERLEAIGVKVISANTDGIVVLCSKELSDEMDKVTFTWMLYTSFELERSDYSALHSRDVNNYIAVKTDGKTKRKGAFSEPTLAKNPEFTIVTDAVAEYLSKGTSIEKTIGDCRDILKFVTVRRVDGGGKWRGEFLGKAVRFYYSSKVLRSEHIAYAKNTNKVPRSDGARPLMTLPEAFPSDVDVFRYVEMARAALTDLGVRSA